MTSTRQHERRAPDTPAIRVVARVEANNRESLLRVCLQSMLDYYDPDLSEGQYDGPGGSPVKGIREVLQETDT